MSRFIDAIGQFLAQRKGLLPLAGCLFVLCNFILQFLAPGSWAATSNLLLHLGILMAILGLLLARVL